MSRDSYPFSCDGCGKRRENDVNRWWLIWEFTHPTLGIPVLAVIAWNEEIALGAVCHTCGQACAQKLVERWLTTGMLEEGEMT